MQTAEIKKEDIDIQPHQPKTQIQEDKEDKNQPTLFLKTTFILLGLSQLIGWNAVLSTFHFFAQQFGPQVFHNFNIPTQIGQFIGSTTIYYLAEKTTILGRINGALFVTAIVMFALPIVAILIPNTTGMAIGMFLVFCIGTFNSIADDSMVAIAGQEGGKLNQLLWFGNGLCGLSSATLTIVLNLALSGLEKSSEISTFVFFVLSVIVIFITMYCTKKYAILRKIDTLENQKIRNSKIKQANGMEIETNNVIASENNQVSYNTLKTDSIGSSSDLGENESPEQKAQKKAIREQQLLESEKSTFIKLLKAIKLSIAYAKFIPIAIMLIYICTFIVFPKMTLLQVQFSSEFLNKDGQLWAILLLNWTFQIGDVIGKYCGGIKFFHNEYAQYALVFSRFGFIATSLLVSNREGSLFSSEWFPFLNMFLMAVTNGLATCSLMEIAPKKGKGQLYIIQTIQFICAIFLMLGIVLGSFLAVPFDPQTEIEYYFDEQ